MPTSIVPPDIRRMFAGLQRRIEILERRIRSDDAGTNDETIFTLPGTVIVSESPDVYLRNGAYVTTMMCTLKLAGTTTTTVVLKQDGTTIATASLGSGVTLATISPRVRWGADSETMSVAVTAAGLGAEDLSVQVRY